MLISCLDESIESLGCDVEARGIWTVTPIPRVDTIDSAILYFNVRKFRYCTLLQLPPFERSSPANFLPWFMVGLQLHFSLAVCLLETMTASSQSNGNDNVVNSLLPRLSGRLHHTTISGYCRRHD